MFVQQFFNGQAGLNKTPFALTYTFKSNWGTPFYSWKKIRTM
jgi:hypothetical protein